MLSEHADADEKTLRRALRDAYPFGERKSWPYKVWLDEIKCQRGKRAFNGGHKPQRTKPTDNPAQMTFL